LENNLLDQGVRHLVEIVIGWSYAPSVLDAIRKAAAQSPIGLLVIDSDGLNLYGDLQRLAPYCQPDCYLVFDDYTEAGNNPIKEVYVKPSVDQLVREGKLVPIGVLPWGTWFGRLGCWEARKSVATREADRDILSRKDGPHRTEWDSGFESPRGEELPPLPGGVSFAVLADDGEPWPTKSAKELGYRFQGYQLDEEQRPIFTYSFEDLHIQDSPRAFLGKAGPSIVRSLRITPGKQSSGLCFRAAVADRIEPLGDGWYKVDDKLKMSVRATPSSGDVPLGPRLRLSAGKTELLVPLGVAPRGAMISIHQEFVW
jgi:hypothetical protein